MLKYLEESILIYPITLTCIKKIRQNDGWIEGSEGTHVIKQL